MTIVLALGVVGVLLALGLGIFISRTITVPLAWFPTLLNATVQQRDHWELLGDGEGIHWPELDADICVAGLLVGIRETYAST